MQIKGLMGILSVGTCLSLQMFRSKCVEYLNTVYIYLLIFILEKDSRESKSIEW